MEILAVAALLVAVEAPNEGELRLCRELAADPSRIPTEEFPNLASFAELDPPFLNCPYLVNGFGRGVEINGQRFAVEIHRWRRSPSGWEFVGSSPAPAVALDGDPQHSYIPNWRVEREPDPISGSENVFASSSSADELRLAFNQIVYPALHVACYNNNTQVYLTFSDKYLGSGRYPVTVRVGAEAAFSEMWQIASGGDAIGHFRGDQAIPFLRRIAGADSMAVRFTPFSENTWTVEFDLTNIDLAVEQVSAACHWRLLDN